MPRDGSGVYTTLAGTHGIPDTTIASTPYNLNVDDVATDLNAPRPIIAGGTGASSAAAARDNLDAERSNQVVTNFDSHVWEFGSFSSAAGATAAPTANAFAGIAYGTDGNNLVVQARDQSTGIPYVRRKVGGTWQGWAIDGADQYVNVIGDTMTGQLLIQPSGAPSTAHLIVAGTPQANNGFIHIRPNAGQNGYITFTEDTIANRMAIGFDGGGSGLNFRQGGVSGPLVAHLTTSGTFVLTASAAVALYAGGIPDATKGFVHIRPSSGQKGYITFTEDTVADKMAIGFDNGSNTLNFRIGNTAGAVLASLSASGVWSISGAVAASSRSTGALIVPGGAGIGMQLHSGGHVASDGAGAGNELAVSLGATTCALGVDFLGSVSSLGIVLKPRSSTYPTYPVYIVNHANTAVGNISIVSGGGGITLNSTSDIRLKQSLVPYQDGLAVIEALKVYEFEWTASPGETYIGLAAQEVNEVYPEAVSVGNEVAPHEPGFRPWMMDNSKLVAPLIVAVQELSARVAALEAQLKEAN